MEVKFCKPTTLEHAMQEEIVVDRNLSNDRRVRQLALGERTAYSNNKKFSNGQMGNYTNDNFQGNRGTYNSSNLRPMTTRCMSSTM